MATLRISRPHALPPAEARARVARAASRIEQRFGADCEWQGDVLVIRHASVNGTVTVAVAEVVVEARLGLALSLARGRAEAEITRILDRELAP
jgi:putative polyhydroxyalkanoate system protein